MTWKLNQKPASLDQQFDRIIILRVLQKITRSTASDKNKQFKKSYSFNNT